MMVVSFGGVSNFFEYRVESARSTFRKENSGKGMQHAQATHGIGCQHAGKRRAMSVEVLLLPLELLLGAIALAGPVRKNNDNGKSETMVSVV